MCTNCNCTGLNIFGFLGSDELRSRSADGSTGNFGVQDQRAALEWVKLNIINFGGDPKKVTIFGESAGAGAVAFHTVAKRSWNLFSRAIMESGGYATWNTATWAEKQKHYPQLALSNLAAAANDGCTDTKSALQCLLGASTEALTLASGGSWSTMYGDNESSLKAGTLVDILKDSTGWGPTVDCVELTEEVFASARRGRMTSADILIGSNEMEAALPARRWAAKGVPTVSMTMGGNADALGNWMAEKVVPQYTTATATNRAVVADTLVDDLLTHYRPSVFPKRGVYGSNWQAAVHIMSDARYSCPASNGAQWAATHGNNVYLYLYGWSGSARFPWAYHGIEVNTVFDMPGTSRLGMLMVTYWTNFATSGNPNTPNSPGKAYGNTNVAEWPRMSKLAANSEFASLDRFGYRTGLTVLPASQYSCKACGMWESLLPSAAAIDANGWCTTSHTPPNPSDATATATATAIATATATTSDGFGGS